MKITATSTLARDLKPGDLLSTVGPEYWNHIDDARACGEGVYIRTNTSADEFPDGDAVVYHITIDTETQP